MNLDDPCTQAEFGALIGISQPAVSEHLSNGVLTAGASARQWLIEYTANLREQAAGRGTGDLAYERALQAKVARERNEIQLAKDRREWAEVSKLTLFCAYIGARVAGLLGPLPSQMHKLDPKMSPEALRFAQDTVSKACNFAASATLADFADPDADPSAPDANSSAEDPFGAESDAYEDDD